MSESLIHAFGGPTQWVHLKRSSSRVLNSKSFQGGASEGGPPFLVTGRR